MRIGELWYPVKTLGFGNRVGIWFQGCTRKCPNCISPEFRALDGGKACELAEIIKRINSIDKPDGLTISGGEPFDQPQELLGLVEWFSHNISDDILIFTGYTLEELHYMKDDRIEAILGIISVLVDGEYVDEMNNGVGMRGSSNQKIYVWKNKERYIDVENKERKMQCVFLEDRMWIIGIPPK